MDSIETSKAFLKKHTDVLICLALLVSILAVYGQVKNFDFIFLDDNLYVAENQNIKNGFSVTGLRWAFLFRNKGFQTYWHPLTWLSHMLDNQMFGLDAGKHHLMNLFFHMANSLLMFLVFYRMTGCRWPSAFVAALFALHPVNVESVAWVAERKNVLSTFFWLMTIFVYTGYTQKHSRVRYMAAFVIFGMGLMAKPMLVTLPFLMLILDYWPLERLAAANFRFLPESRRNKLFTRSVPTISMSRAVIEKIPFGLLSGAMVYLSSSTLSSFHTMATVEQVPLLLRLSNALVTYIKYVLKMIIPRKLSILYLFPKNIAWWEIMTAAALLLLVSILVVKEIRRRPYLAMGWFWYLGTLVPVIGLVQAGMWPEMADRWAYVPFIGLFVMAAWGSDEIIGILRLNRTIPSILAGAVLLVFAVLAWIQLGHWQSSDRILKHALCVDPQNFMMHVAYGAELEESGNGKAAIRHYKEALKISPGFVGAHINLGGALARQGNVEKATFHFQQALRLAPNSAAAHFNIGKAYADIGDLKSAHGYYVETIRLKPEFIPAYNNLANILFLQGRINDAIRIYRDALEIEPDNDLVKNNLSKLVDLRRKDHVQIHTLIEGLNENPRDYQAHIKIGNWYKVEKQWKKAKTHYQKALSLQPLSVEAIHSMGIICAMSGKYDTARLYFEKNIRLRPDVPDSYYSIAGTFARQQRTEDAIVWLKKAVSRGFENWTQLRKDPNFYNIRKTAYYKGLVQER
ncbi:tetratricopeptide repeat protein [Thermodesulfobacteriota bacterium]